MRIPFAIMSGESYAPRNSRQRLVNAYARPEAEGSKEQLPIFGTPGIKAWTTVGSTQLRGAAVWNGQLYVVADKKLYLVESDGTATSKGNIRGSGRVSMAVGSKLAISIGGDTWYYDNTGLSQIGDADFQGAAQVEWIAGYYIYPKPDTDVFYISGVESPGTISANDYATAESMPDKIVSIKVDHNDLLLFGEQTTEIWGLRGTSFPFARQANGVIELGCGAKWSPAKLDNSVFWFANDRTVRVLRGVTPQKVSNHDFETAVARYATVSDAVGISYSVAGRSTYVLRFPSEGATWQYSLTTGLWNELASYDQDCWRGFDVIECYGKTLVLDAYSNKIGYFDIDTYQEWGDTLQFEMVSAPIAEGNKYLYHYNLFADFETGGFSTVTDAVTGADRDAVVMLDWSDDGRDWSDIYTRNIGREGEHLNRVAWSQGLGRSKNRTYRLRITDNVPRQFLGAEGDIGLGSY